MVNLLRPVALTCIYQQIQHTHTHTHVHIHTHTYTHTCSHTLTYTQTHTHVHTHTCQMHSHTHRMGNCRVVIEDVTVMSTIPPSTEPVVQSASEEVHNFFLGSCQITSCGSHCEGRQLVAIVKEGSCQITSCGSHCEGRQLVAIVKEGSCQITSCGSHCVIHNGYHMYT